MEDKSMDIGGAVKIKYWAAQEGEAGLRDLEGIDEFRGALKANYLSQVHARPAGLGGLYGLTVEFITALTLQHFINLIVDGIAWDLVKAGGEALVLRPFFAAYNALKRKNAAKARGVYIDELLLSFQDSIVVIQSLGGDTVVGNVEQILRALAVHYRHLILRSGEKPFSISIPVFEDPSEDRLCRFRELLDVDETIRDISEEQYLSLWGMQYDYSWTTRVFDVKRQVLIDEEFYTRARYWRAWEDRERARRG
jgi:hypothetical protein